MLGSAIPSLSPSQDHQEIDVSDSATITAGLAQKKRKAP
jgi:hypothetical protein